MLFDNVNLNNLKVFESVYRTRCMTTASKELHLTQSGVSQHIKTLEETLDILLFDRVNRKIMPTNAGDRLYRTTRPIFDNIKETLMDIAKKEIEVEGRVNVGMPIEFGNNIVIPKLAKLSQEYPGLNFGLRMGFASEMNQMLLEGTLDFAFVDAYPMDRKIHVEKVAEEVLDLCASQVYLQGRGTLRNSKPFFESLDYVAYEAKEPVLRSWFTHHIRRRNLNLNIRAHVMDVQGVARFIINNIGVGVIPNHLITKLLSEGHELHVFKGSGKPLKNPLSLAYLKNRSRNLTMERVLHALKPSLQEKSHLL